MGNRAAGDRPSANPSAGQLAVSAALALLTPFTALLFMGEEWAASTPFQFFTSHPEPDIAEATRQGRQAEFADHGWAGEVPDPQDPRTFRRSKLNWDELTGSGHVDRTGCTASLSRCAALNATSPTSGSTTWRSSSTRPGSGSCCTGAALAIACNLGADAVVVPVTGQVVLAWGTTQPDATTTTLAGYSFAVLRIVAADASLVARLDPS